MKLDDFPFATRLDLKGMKIAKVIRNDDPKNQERVLVRVLGVHDEVENVQVEIGVEEDDYGIWAMHCSPIRAKSDTPEIGDWLWVNFPNPSDPQFILWFGWVRYSTQTINETDEIVITPSTVSQKINIDQ